MLAGDADLALAWSTLEGSAAAGYGRGVLRKMVADGTLTMAGIRIVWQSPLIPYGPHTIRSDLPDDLKAELRPIVLDMAVLDPEAYAAIDRTGGDGLVAIEPSQFAVLDVLFDLPAGEP
jgi:phosphonate transport system substrate-binding protein